MDAMSRREWRCRNQCCPVPHGAVLGRLTADNGLVLDAAVASFRCYLDTRRAEVRCPACGTIREFRGGSLIGPRKDGDGPGSPGDAS